MSSLEHSILLGVFAGGFITSALFLRILRKGESESCKARRAIKKKLSRTWASLMHQVRPRTLARWKSAGILLTYRCNAKCADCYENSGPDRRALLPAEDLRGILRELKKLGFTGRDLHFAGGEPFFDYKHLIECFEVAKQEGMLPLGKLETNGFWCKSETMARKRLEEIKEFGIDLLLISCDPFHQEYIPIGTIQQAERIAKEVLGDDAVRVAPRELIDNPIDIMRLSPDEKTETFRELLNRQPMRIIGRAAKQLSHLVEKFPKEEFANEHCGRKLLWKGTIHVDPYGNVFPSVCSGINLGNAREMPLSKIHDDFDYDAHPMIRTLVEKGPLALMDEAIECGFKDMEGGYASKCHLCYEARCFFWEQGMYRDEIGPAEVYVD